ncbi:MAG: glycosyltransferase family 2 protein [Thermoplasmata archaeon]
MLSGWELGLFVASAVCIVGYFPIALLQDVGILLTRLRRRRRRLPPPVPGRHVLVMMTTAGNAPHVVEKILAELRGYGLPIELAVVKEAGDLHRYPAAEIVVPPEYSTAHGSRRKMRAQQYAAEWLRQHGYGAETYVVHLDDDSVPDREYLEHVFGMHEEGGQGTLRLREYGRSLWTTLTDFVRVSDCDAFCANFNSLGQPMMVHGEGLTLRADVEEEIGWDYATFGAEDLMTGIQVGRRYRWGFIPYHIRIAPPITISDLYTQRRRWHYSFVSAARRIAGMRWSVMVWFIYRYYVGWTGLFGLTLWVANIALGIPFPVWLVILGLFNLVSYFGFYQYGAWMTKGRYSILTLLLQFPVSYIECGTLFYTLLRPPNPHGFDVIRKV